MRKHLTYANVVSSLCLFLLLGGAAYAGTQLSKGSVGTNALKAEAVTKGKLHPNSVNSKKVVDNSLTGSDVDASTLGKVPNATNAEHAKSAGSATSASTATNADNAANAEKLDGHVPGEFGPVLVASTAEEVTFAAEAELYFSVSGVFAAEAEAKRVSLTLPGRKFKASDFVVRLEGEAQVGVSVHASLVVNGTATEVCTVTVVPSSCTPSTGGIEIPAGAQVAWKIVSGSPVEARPEFALRLLPS
jgi:hypothetical protein